MKTDTSYRLHVVLFSTACWVCASYSCKATCDRWAWPCT